MKNEDRSLVQSVERALALLNALAEQDGGLTLTVLCEQVNLHASTAHRLLATLSEHGYVRQDSRSKTYRLGFQILQLGDSAWAQLDLRDETIRDLELLSERTGELANLVMHNGFQTTSEFRATYVAQANRQGREPVKMFTQIGAQVSLHCTAEGKSVLAYMPEVGINQFIRRDNLTAYTENTITDPDQLLRELEQIREQGYAVDNEERSKGIRGVASPIRDSRKRVIASIGITGPSGRVTSKRTHELAELVRDVTLSISQQIGFPDK